MVTDTARSQLHAALTAALAGLVGRTDEVRLVPGEDASRSNRHPDWLLASMDPTDLCVLDAIDPKRRSTSLNWADCGCGGCPPWSSQLSYYGCPSWLRTPWRVAEQWRGLIISPTGSWEALRGRAMPRDPHEIQGEFARARERWQIDSYESLAAALVGGDEPIEFFKRMMAAADGNFTWVGQGALLGAEPSALPPMPERRRGGTATLLAWLVDHGVQVEAQPDPRIWNQVWITHGGRTWGLGGLRRRPAIYPVDGEAGLDSLSKICDLPNVSGGAPLPLYELSDTSAKASPERVRRALVEVLGLTAAAA